MNDDDRHDAGMKVRRAVLGDAHVDRTLKNRNDFNEEYQDFITRYAWGEIWTRPGLPRHTRSLIMLALMVALNRGDEFKMHVRAAFNNGVTRDEIKEVLLQCAIYAGVPAANSAFHMAQQVFDEMDAAAARLPHEPDLLALGAHGARARAARHGDLRARCRLFARGLAARSRHRHRAELRHGRRHADHPRDARPPARHGHRACSTSRSCA